VRRERNEKLPHDDDAEATEGRSMCNGKPEVWAEGERRRDRAVNALAEREMVRFMVSDRLQPPGEEMV
jgi:hypothetical protein